MWLCCTVTLSATSLKGHWVTSHSEMCWARPSQASVNSPVSLTLSSETYPEQICPLELVYSFCTDHRGDCYKLLQFDCTLLSGMINRLIHSLDLRAVNFLALSLSLQ